MKLRFHRSDIQDRHRGLTFDDVLLCPNRSDIRSRKEPELDAQVTKRHRLKIPIISANMDTITEVDMALAIGKLGGLGILHRFMPMEEQVKQAEQLKSAGLGIRAASVGVQDDSVERAGKLVRAGVNILAIDIAHGHSVQMLETLKKLKDKFPDVDVIAGNVATPEACEELIEAGADAIKVGIGPGSMCTTRIITGCGVPQLTAIAITSEVALKHGVPIVGDGGLRASGDLVKAFAAGADTVMLGSMLSGTIETPGEIQGGKKKYRGMASKAAQVSWRGELPEGMAAEGESTQVPVKGHVKDVVLEILGGIRSGMSYVNATRLSEIRERALFIEMTAAGTMESHAHGVRK